MKKNIKKNIFFSLTGYIIFFILITYVSKIFNINGGLDAKFGYSVSQAYEFLDKIGKSGINHYFLILFIDYFYLIFYSTFLYYLLYLALNALFPDNSFLVNKLSFLALTGGFFDIIENTIIFIILFRYPIKIVLTVKILNIITILKWVFILITIIFILILYIIIIVKKVNKKINRIKHSKN